MSLLCLLLGSAALAHPMANNLYGHRLELRLEPDRLRALYVAEVPTPVVLRELRERADGAPDRAATDQYVAALREELVDGLRLKVDGQSVAWARSDEPAPAGEGDARFVSIGASLTAPLPPGGRTLQIVNGNFPDEASLFLVDVSVLDAVIIDDTSLIERGPDGRLEHDRAGQWRAEEQSRDVALAYRARAPLWTALLRAGAALSGRGERAAWDGPSARLADAPWGGLALPERVALGVVTGAAILGGALGALLGGGARRRGALLASAAIAGVSLMWIATLLVGRMASLTLSSGLCFGASALAAGLWSARAAARQTPRRSRMTPVWAVLLALLAGAALFIWGSVQFSATGA